MTNDNHKCPDCNKDKDHHDHILYCKPADETKPIPSEPFIMPNQEIHPCFSGCKKCNDTNFCSCECHQPSGVSICKPVEPSLESIGKKEEEKLDRAIIDALTVEPSSKHESWCNWHKDNRLCSCKTVFCNVVEPSVEEIAEKITAEAFYKGLKLQMEPWLREKIAEALRNERNRK